MTAPATDPRPDDDDGNPFLAITGPVTKTGGSGDGALAAPPEPANDDDSDNPFLKITGPVAPATSAGGAFARGAARGVLPALGALPAIGIGAEFGAAAGTLGGPFAPLTVPAGGIIGGLAGGFLGATAISSAQDWVLSKLPESWTDAIGLSDRQEQLDAKYHGTASFLGGLAPYAVAMRPGIAGRAALPDNATALQRIMAHPATAHVFSGAVMGGMELGQEAAHGDAPDWSKVAISTAFGVVFNRPTRIGETLIDVGARPARRLLGRSEPAPAAAPQPPDGGPESAVRPEAAPAAETPSAAPVTPPVTRQDWQAEILERTASGRPYELPPTIADAADLKVMGPGVTEDVFLGSHAQDPSAEATARETKRTEQSVIGPVTPPDIHATARRIAPDLFLHYEGLQARKAEFERWAQEEPAAAARHLAVTDQALRDIEPQVQAAYRRAAEATGGEIIEPEAPEQPKTDAEKPIEAQRDFIRNDVARQLIRAGRPEEEAHAAGALIAARYEARASQFNGRMGTPEDIYRAEAAEILGPGMRSHQPKGIAQPRGQRTVNEEKLSLTQFLAHRGGVKPTADLKAMLGDNPFVPGFGRLFRESGMTEDHAREAASEAGYLPNHETEGQKATIRDLHTALHEETRGRRRYRPGHEPEAGAVEAPEPPEGGEPGEAAELAPERESELMSAEDWRDFYQRRRNRDLIVERELQGQLGLPGTERISQAEQAQRLANAPLRPPVEQRPMDEGLFGDEKAQKELFQGAHGKISLMEGRRPIITLMKDANASTFIHESGHDFLEQLLRDAEHEAAPDQLKTDAAATLKWLGVETRDDVKTRQHEKFARGFEQYLREGIAPSSALASVFAKFKAWLTRIYTTLKGLGSPINDDIRQVFDRMLAAEPQRTVIAPERMAEGMPRSLAEIHEADAQEIAPHEADAAKSRVDDEIARAYREAPDDILAEIQDAEARFFAEHEAVDPAREAGGVDSAAAEVSSAGGGPEPVTQGGGVVPEPRAEHGSFGEARREGARLRNAASGPGDREEPGAVPLAPSPAAQFSAGSAFNLGKRGNIRVENITSVPQFMAAIEESSERIGGGGPLTMGEMIDLADQIAIDPKDITEAKLAGLFGGVRNLSSKIWALREAIKESAEIVHEAMRNVRDTNSDQAVVEFARVVARHDMMQSVLSSVTTEAGRGLGMGFRNLEGWQKAQDLNEFLKANTGRTLFQLKQVAKLGAQLDSPAKVSKFLRDAQKRSFGGMILEYWINGLISGPATHVTYMMGNQVLALQKAVPETMIASVLGSFREGERVRMGEVGAGLKSMVRSLPAATQAFLEAMRTGQTTLLPGEHGRALTPFQGDTAISVARSIGNEPVTWTEVGAQMFGMMRGLMDGVKAGADLIKAGGEAGAPVVGLHWSPLGQIPDVAIRGVPVVPIGSAIRLPGRSVAAIHSFFRTANYLREGAAEAYRTASNEGLSGDAFASRIAQVRTNPDDAMMERWRAGATAATLMSEGGPFVKALSQLTNAKVQLPLIGDLAPLKFIDPFVHIGANVINQAIVQRTPIGVLSAEIRADLMGRNGAIAQDMAAARMLAGTAMSLVFGGLAMNGYASGSGPKDPAKAAMWRLAGNQPHSIRIGDTWYQVNRLGPMGMLLSIAADMYEVAHDATEGEYLTAAAHFQHAVTQNILDESFMRGPSDLIKAVEDPGRYGEAYLKQMVSSFVPFSVGAAQIARAADPYARQTRSVVDEMTAKLPWARQSLFAKRDIWGEPLPNPEALGLSGLSAVWEQKVSSDPVNQAMLALGIAPAKLERKIRNVDLTDQEYDDFARMAGRMAKQRLDVIVRSPDFQTWPGHIRHDVMTEVIKQSREAARGVMMMQSARIVHEATDAQRKRKTGEPTAIH